MEFIEKLGIDFRLLIAQIINFFILLFVLYKFAYRPILGLLDKRSHRIEKSLSDAKAIEEKLATTEKTAAARLTRAEQEAERIVTTSRAEAEKIRVATLDRAKAEVDVIVKKTQAEVAELKNQVINEARAELADLVVDATGRVLGEKLTEAKDLDLVERTLAEAKR